MTPNTETAGKVAVTIDPKGAWNDQRFAFCNALETALDEAVAPQIRAAAWDELERLGVRPAIKAEQGEQTWPELRAFVPAPTPPQQEGKTE